jgi:hypothetical protein
MWKKVVSNERIGAGSARQQISLGKLRCKHLGV